MSMELLMLIKRIEFLLVGVLAALSLTANAQTAPNIVYLMTDDQRADTAGFMGNSIIQTPHLDALASQGVVFDNAFVPTAICMTNRASVLTGQYASRHGIWSFNANLSAQQLNNTYIGQLNQAGYYTGFVGKWGVGDAQSSNVNSILDYNEGYNGQGNFNTTRDDGSPVHLTTLLAEQAEEFIDQAAQQSQPFSLSVSFKAPHVQDGLGPDEFLQYDPALSSLYVDDTIPDAVLDDPAFFNAQPSFIRNSLNRSRWVNRHSTEQRYQDSVKGYYRLITGVDNAVGSIMSALEDPNGDGDTSDSVADNTIVIFTSDHGLYLGDRGLAGKWLPHEQSIKVPLIIHDPRDTSQHGTRRDQNALSIDMAATMLDYAGVTIPDGIQGVSLAGIADGQPTEWREEFFYEHRVNISSIPQSEAIRTDQYKYISYVGRSFEELYDLQADPIEAVNLAENGQYASVLAEMRFKLNAWRSEVQTSDTLPLSIPQTINPPTGPVISLINSSFEADENTSSNGAFAQGDATDFGGSITGWVAVSGAVSGVSVGWKDIPPSQLHPIPPEGGQESQALSLQTGSGVTNSSDVAWSALSIGDELTLTISVGMRDFDLLNWNENTFFGLIDLGADLASIELADTVANSGILSNNPATGTQQGDGTFVDVSLSHTINESDLLRPGNIGVLIYSEGSGAGGSANQSFFDNVRLTIDFAITPGDFNNDGIVDLADYTVWRNNLGEDDSVLPVGSTDGQGVVDSGDYQLWKDNFGSNNSASQSSGDTSVPEPSSAFLIAAFAAILLACRCRAIAPH